MKYLFVPAKIKKIHSLPQSAIDTLKTEQDKHNIAISGAIQFVNSLPNIKEQLTKEGFKADIITGSHSVEPGQVVGCDYFDIDDSPYDMLIYIGDGVFHPKAMMLANNKEVYQYNPFEGAFTKLDRSHMDKLKKYHKAAILKFLHAQNIGVIVTIKPGQNRSVFVPKIKKKLNPF